MFQRLFFILMSLTLSVSCNIGEKKDTQDREVKNQSSPSNCYRYAKAGDTIHLRLVHVGDDITGILVYDYKEKDMNKGTILGGMRGNLLVARYTFLSEGIQSVRQVVFKLAEKGFIEGYGDIYSENDNVYFRNLDSLQFNESMKLVEIACPSSDNG